ncbi:hypothetical protein LCGC14_0357810 [marine sediment metagenome]|uniref:Uncharacterized protein n=1 Tax=marine sediment metagenome TaxID=412755 RepID=A0A0F9VW18_9ZZZZ
MREDRVPDGMRGDSSAIKCHEQRKMRTRWHRWLGQKCRWDNSVWTELLNCNWMGWATTVLAKRGSDHKMRDKTRDDVKEIFSLAITLADYDDLLRLDNLFAETLV